MKITFSNSKKPKKLNSNQTKMISRLTAKDLCSVVGGRKLGRRAKN